MTDKLKQLLDQAQHIFITAHTSPDPDAVSSLLLLGTTLEENFPDKQVGMVLEEEPDGLDFLTGYDKIHFQNVYKSIEELKPELIILVDSNGYDRISRNDGQKIKEYIVANDVKTAIIDHHEPDDKDETDVYINSGGPAAVQEIYEVCFDSLKLKKPEGYAQTTMLGIYADSGGFAYQNPHYKQTFALVSKLVEAGASIEQTKNRLSQYSEDRIRVIAELLLNLSHEADYNYSFIGDKFVAEWLAANKPFAALHSARKKFVDDYIRNIEGRQWGFVISIDPQEEGHVYSVSLRAVGGVKDVAAIARKLNGGGHKPAAGGKVIASNLDEAIAKVKAVIAQAE